MKKEELAKIIKKKEEEMFRFEDVEDFLSDMLDRNAFVGRNKIDAENEMTQVRENIQALNNELKLLYILSNLSL